MLNFELKFIPQRPEKPRTKGMTMVIDKGLSLRETEDFLSVAGEYVDVVKLGWGTSVITPNLKEKIAILQSFGMPVYFGGTLFEIFYVRNQVDDYKRILEKFGLNQVEISDGSMLISEKDKCEVIKSFAQNFTVYSEVGSKDAKKVIAPFQWVEMMQAELNAGSSKVIAEARESGNVGTFNSDGGIRGDLIEEILAYVPHEKILWEAPQKSQQVWFLKQLGIEVNLGNIAPSEALPLETLRLGLRGDTFNMFLPK
ncbi:MAG: phosphosulfolactate synthase [Bacteroidia bacterium]